MNTKNQLWGENIRLGPTKTSSSSQHRSLLYSSSRYSPYLWTVLVMEAILALAVWTLHVAGC